MKRALGKQETQFLAYAQMRRARAVRAGEFARPLGLSKEQERELFRRLSRGRLIARVRPGLYLLPERLPLGGAWTPSDILALNTLMADRGGRYQICGPNVFNRYGFDEQVPNRVYAYNDKISGDRSIGAVQLTLIRVAPERLGGTEEVKTTDGDVAVYASRARALVDAVYDWARFNTLPRGYRWVRSELKKKRVTAQELADMTLRYGDLGTIRRMGALLQSEGCDERLLRKLERRLPESSGLIPWVPTQLKRGRIDRRWGLVMNEDA